MALVRYGGGIVQMSGSIAGDTFARNRYGNYSRARTKPVNPKSDRQVAIRALIMYLTEEWNTTLSGAQRTAWGSYANAVPWTNKLGEVIHLSGFNMFIRSGTIRRQWAGTYIAPGPTTMALPPGDSLFAVAISEANGITFTFDDNLAWVSEDNAAMSYYIGTPQNASRTFFAGPWRFDSALGGSSGAPKTSPHGPEVITSWTLTQGQRVWVRGRIVRADGRASTIFTAASVLVGA